MQRSTARIKPGGASAAEKFLSFIPDGKSISDGGDSIREICELEQLASISMARFSSLPAGEIDREVTALLRQILESCQFDRLALMMLTRDKTKAMPIHISQADGLVAAPDTFAFSDMFPWTGESLLKGNIVCFSSLTELPPVAVVDRRHYEAMGVQSSLAIPIYVGGSVEYFIVAHQACAGKIWRKETISLLRLISEVLVNAHLDYRKMGVWLQFEQLISELSVKFINITAGTIDREIISALGRVREIFQFDRLGLITLSPDKVDAMVSHVCYGEGIARVPERVDISLLFPWAKEKLLRGEILHVTSVDDLPEEAAVDRQSWQAMGVKANASIPIYVGGSVEYLIAAHDVRAGRCLNKELLPRLRLLGEIFANALNRCKSEEEQRNSWAEIQRLKEKLQSESEYIQSEIVCSQRHEEIIGQSDALAKTLVLTEQVAPTNSTVLICGETGTGKELIAGAIHKLSMRRTKLMVKVNCASLPTALVESELFGREKGAYTGALTRQAGRFEVADGGTIFLDEIAEMSLDLQVKLLRVLQEGQFERLGSTKTIQVDVRVIAATNRNLAEEVKKGNFREDLYYRLNVFQIVIPPLRERIDDIPLLVWAFINEYGEKMGKKINKVSKQDMIALQRYPWPGNVRELRNVIEHAVIVSTGDRLQVRLPENNREETPGILTLEEYEIRHIQEALRLTGWRIKGEGGAAMLLGLNPSTLYSRMQKLGISNRPVKDEMSP